MCILHNTLQKYALIELTIENNIRKNKLKSMVDTITFV